MSATKPKTLPPPPPNALCAKLGIQSITIEWLAGDGSDRCYYRLTSPELKTSLVLMQLSGRDAEALKEGGYDWISIGRILSREGIRVPSAVKEIPEHSALVIDDYGNIMLESVVLQKAKESKWQEIEELYTQALQICEHMLRVKYDPNAVWCKRRFDQERFEWELNFFVEKYVKPIGGITFAASEQKAFTQDVAALSTWLAERPQHFVHRDLHSRNIMVKHGELALIDFQDARLGPASYDTVSLVFDSYVPFAQSFRAKLLGKMLTNARTSIEDEWKPMLLQRQLKAIGSFGYLTIDKNKGDYLKNVGPALQILEEFEVQDKRWPFLSGELLKRMRNPLKST